MPATKTLRSLLALAAALAALVAGRATEASVTPPPAGAQLDYQIGGAYTPDPGVGVVDRDRTVAPAPGAYNICYVNAFQTQPEAARWWRAHHRGLLLRSHGRYVVDSAWNEMLLDTSTAAKRRALVRIVGRWIDGCRRSGFQAVEPDNLDSWGRSRGRLTMRDNKAYASLLIARAHARGLAIAQKNTPELGGAGRAMGFDFAIAEECNVYDECDRYTGPFGDRVYEIEYTDNGGAANFDAACSARGAAISIVYRDRAVVARGGEDYTYQAC